MFYNLFLYSDKIYKNAQKSAGKINVNELNRQDKEAIINNKVERSEHPWCDSCYIEYVDICKNVAVDWGLSIDEWGHFDFKQFENKVKQFSYQL
jgi:hypothetical protein